MLKFKRLMMILTVIFVFCGMNISAFAYENPDMDRLGSIKIVMRYENKPIAGGSFALYNVGKLTEKNGKYEFVLADNFAGSNVNLADTAKAYAYAETLLTFAKENSVKGITKEVNSDGNVIFENLPSGVYLLNQEDVASEQYEAAEPFLVYIPLEKNGAYIYDITANPKVALVKNPEEPTNDAPKNDEPTSDNPTNDDPTSDNQTNGDPTNDNPTGSNTDSSTNQTDKKLPHTGQLKWPIPILAISGLALVLCGSLCLGKRKANEK